MMEFTEFVEWIAPKIAHLPEDDKIEVLTKLLAFIDNLTK